MRKREEDRDREGKKYPVSKRIFNSAKKTVSCSSGWSANWTLESELAWDGQCYATVSSVKIKLSSQIRFLRSWLLHGITFYAFSSSCARTQFPGHHRLSRRSGASYRYQSGRKRKKKWIAKPKISTDCGKCLPAREALPASYLIQLPSSMEAATGRDKK